MFWRVRPIVMNSRLLSDWYRERWQIDKRMLLDLLMYKSIQVAILPKVAGKECPEILRLILSES